MVYQELSRENLTMKTLIATLFILFVVSMPVHAESEFKYWETSTYTNEATNRIEKRLVYILPKKPRRLGPNYVFLLFLVIPTNQYQ